MATPATDPAARPTARPIHAGLRGIGVAIVMTALSIAGCGEKPEQPAAGTDEQTADEQAAASIDNDPRFDDSIFGVTEEEADPQITVGLRWDTPPGWVSIAKNKIARLEEWKVPEASDELLVFALSFGTTMGQSIDFHIDRWGSQFRQQDGSRPEPALETWESDGLKFTLMTFTAQSMTGLAIDDLGLGANGARMIGAIIEGGPKGLVMFRMSGRTTEVEEHTPAFLGMIRSIELRDGAPTP